MDIPTWLWPTLAIIGWAVAVFSFAAWCAAAHEADGLASLCKVSQDGWKETLEQARASNDLLKDLQPYVKEWAYHLKVQGGPVPSDVLEKYIKQGKV